MFVEKTDPVGYNELATVAMPDGIHKERTGPGHIG